MPPGLLLCANLTESDAAINWKERYRLRRLHESDAERRNRMRMVPFLSPPAPMPIDPPGGRFTPPRWPNPFGGSGGGFGGSFGPGRGPFG